MLPRFGKGSFSALLAVAAHRGVACASSCADLGYEAVCPRHLVFEHLLLLPESEYSPAAQAEQAAEPAHTPNIM